MALFATNDLGASKHRHIGSSAYLVRGGKRREPSVLSPTSLGDLAKRAPFGAKSTPLVSLTDCAIVAYWFLGCRQESIAVADLFPTLRYPRMYSLARFHPGESRAERSTNYLLM